MVEVSFEGTNVCKPIKLFINWIISELNFEYNKPIKFVYSSPEPKKMCIYWENKNNLSDDQIKRSLEDLYFLQSLTRYSMFYISFPSGFKYSFDIRFLVKQIIRGGGTISFEGIENDQERIIFMQSFMLFAGYFMKDFSDKKTLGLNDLTEMLHSQMNIYSPNYYLDVKETIKAMLKTEKDYSIEYKFMKAIEKTVLFEDYQSAYYAWILGDKKWNKYCDDHNIEQLRIYHRDRNNFILNGKVDPIKFIKRSDLCPGYSMAMISSFERIYSISIPKQYYDDVRFLIGNITNMMRWNLWKLILITLIFRCLSVFVLNESINLCLTLENSLEKLRLILVTLLINLKLRQILKIMLWFLKLNYL